MTAYNHAARVHLLGVILRFNVNHGRPPTLVELAHHSGLSGGRQALWYVNDLRSLRVLRDDARITLAQAALVGMSRCVLHDCDPFQVAADLLTKERHYV